MKKKGIPGLEKKKGPDTFKFLQSIQALLNPITWKILPRGSGAPINLGTNMTVSQLKSYLIQTGFTSKIVDGGKAIWTKGDMTYTIYIDSSFGKLAAQYFYKGNTIKIRLGG